MELIETPTLKSEIVSAVVKFIYFVSIAICYIK
jgi:hypothetical protein